MAKKLPLKSFRLKNFKAIRDSGVVKFTPLTVLIGDNGSGKSSLTEGLQTYQRIITENLDKAMQVWRGFEHIVNPPVDLESDLSNPQELHDPVEFVVRGLTDTEAFRSQIRVNMSPQSKDIFIEMESLQVGNRKVLERDRNGKVVLHYGDGNENELSIRASSGVSVIAPWFMVMNPAVELGNASSREAFTEGLNGFNWQFVFLKAQSMGDPRLIERSGGRVRLKSDGSNIAEYLLDIRRQDKDAFEGILEALQYILPYVKKLESILTSELERAVFIRIQENEYKIPGWLFSTGSLRVLALLALFRHPDPPPLIVIEEIENGLDPRTIHLIVDEIRNVVESGRSQVILTTHSPYLLDLMPLSSIVLVERVNGEPTFNRPADDDSLKGWSKKFAPGKLYTMGNLNRQKTV